MQKQNTSARGPLVCAGIPSHHICGSLDRNPGYGFPGWLNDRLLMVLPHSLLSRRGQLAQPEARTPLFEIDVRRIVRKVVTGA